MKSLSTSRFEATFFCFVLFLVSNSEEPNKHQPVSQGEIDLVADQGSFAVFSLLGRYQLNKTFELFATLKNLSDKDYLTPSSPTQLNRGVQNRGRELEFGIRLNL